MLNPITIDIFDSYVEAEEALDELVISGYDLQQISVMNKNYSSQNDYNGGNFMMNKPISWSAHTGLLWGLLELNVNKGSYFIPAIGSVFMAGPVVSLFEMTLDEGQIQRGVGALEKFFQNLGIPQIRLKRYQVALNANKYLVIMHGKIKDVVYGEYLMRKLNYAHQLL